MTTFTICASFRPSSCASVRASLPDTDFGALIRSVGLGAMPATASNSAANADGSAICPMASARATNEANLALRRLVRDIRSSFQFGKATFQLRDSSGTAWGGRATDRRARGCCMGGAKEEYMKENFEAGLASSEPRRPLRARRRHDLRELLATKTRR